MISTEQAIQKLISELKSDNGYWFAWQSNIAMAFHDEMIKRGYRLPDLHDLSNQAAINFLNILTAERKND